MISQSQSSKALRIILIFSCLTIVVSQNWSLQYSKFQSWTFNSPDGWVRGDGAAPQIITCPHNSMSILCLDGNYQINKKTISGLPAHFELKLIVDVYFIDNWDGENGEVYFDGTQIYSQQEYFSTLTPYENQCGGWQGGYELTLKTIYHTISHTLAAVDLQIQTSLDQPFSDESYCFRNVQLWARLCHPTCQTCNGDADNNCLTCYTGSPSSGKCTCTNSNAMFFQPYSGCTSECLRTTYLADTNNYCQYNEKITQYSTSLVWPQYTMATSIDWQLFTNGILVSQKTFVCGGWLNVGKYDRSDIIKKSMLFAATVRKIRIRINLYQFSTWNQYSSIMVLMDGQLINMVYRFSGQFKTIKSKRIQSSVGNCPDFTSDNVFNFIRTEQIVKLISLTPNFEIMATQDQWVVKSIYIDQIVCALNCSTCLDDDNCSACNGGYFLHKGQCVTSCPIHSTVSSNNCIDFDEETQYTSYLLKAFYLEGSPDTEATDYFSLISFTGTNFAKGVHWSYLRNKRIFGGALTWLNAIFSQTYSIAIPHYAVRVRMVVILGDNFGLGSFLYSVDGGPNQTITKSTTELSHSQQWGDTYDEYFYQVNDYVSHTSSSLPITVECQGDPALSLINGFCGIQDYFITILEVIFNNIQCPPLCTACTSLTSCSAWISSPYIDTVTHNCFPGYYVDYATRSCLPFPVCGNGIIEADEECDDGNQIEIDNCFNCKFQCQSYYPNCPILNFKTCDSGYYLNLFDNSCYPLCGDKLIVKEEDCDDGNLLPFDGCYQCQFSCQESCSECRDGKCSRCQSGWKLNQLNQTCDSICGNGNREVTEECDESNSFQEADFCYSCQFLCPKHCMNCSYGFCSQCEMGFQLNQVKNDCQPICGDTLVVSNEECDDGNLIPQDGCHQCLYQCQDICLDCKNGKCSRCQSGWKLNQLEQACDPIGEEGSQNESYANAIWNNEQFLHCTEQLVKGDSQCINGNLITFDECFEYQSFNCQSQCLVYYNKICQKCKNEIGWQLNAFGFCETNCGDSIIAPGIEECDDGNQVQYDGCFECRLDCQAACTLCWKDSCYECNTPGWYLANEICNSVCGDGIVVQSEQCDDGNDEMYDGCYECQFQCEEACSQCENGVCFDCVIGWEINPLKICQGICGDSIVAHPYEECDDGNLEPFDGCYECRFQCEELCTTCIDGVCYECDVLGWQINDENHKCEPICNDGLIIGLEQCDDMNLIPYDGCYECKFQCHKSCLQCEEGICLKCDYGYTTYHDQCESFCGDGQMSDLKECDDGNLIDVDGCSSECKIEENWACVTEASDASICFISKLPKLQLSLFDKNSTELQIVSLKFDTKMELISKDIQPQFSFRILDLQNTYYKVVVSPIVSLAKEAQFVEYNLYIYFNISVYRPTLIVVVSNVTNQYQQNLSIIEGRIYLRDSEIISEWEKKAIDVASSFSLIVLYVMAGLTALAILTGNLEMVWNLLDMLQFLSYLQYVNIAFPLNLDTYFEIFKLVTISPLLEYLWIGNIFSVINDGETPFVETVNKFKEDEINAYFLSNFTTFLLCFLLAYLTIIFPQQYLSYSINQGLGLKRTQIFNFF